jgi:predicted dehydrogenase
VNSKMRVGIIGSGIVTSAGHIPAYRKLGLEIVGVADSNKAALKRINAKRKYTNFNDLLKQDLDFVSICTPPFLHEEMCIAAAERGINILVEKPLALNSNEGAAIKKAIKQNGVKLSVVHNYKFIEPFAKAKKMQTEGQLGRVLSIHCIVHGFSPPAWDNWKIDETKSGSMILQWNHPLYLESWFGGIPKSVFAIGKTIIPNYPLIADLQVLINFGNTTGFIEMSQFTNNSHFSCRITGTGASLDMQPTTFKVLMPSTATQTVDDVLTSTSNAFKILRSFFVMRYRPHIRYTWGSHYRLICKFVDSIKNESIVPADVDEGILSIKLAEAINQSVYLGEKVTL